MQKNAFELLRSGGLRYSQSQGQSQKQSKKRRSSVEQQTSYSTCPVCGDSSIPTWHLEQHVASCLDKPATQNATQNKSGTAKKRRHAAAGPPVPAAAVPPSLPHSSSSPATAGATQTNSPASAAPPQQQAAAAAADAKAATADGSVNAFAVITRAQAAQVPLEATMFLEACSDGRWLCHWWNKGSPPPNKDLTAAWTASANVNLPKQESAATAGGASKGGSSRQSVLDIPTGSAKLVLQLATNVPSGYGTAVDWSNPLLPSNGSKAQQQHQQQGDEDQDQQQHHSVEHESTAAGAAAVDGGGKAKGLSLLISALQKCIRRGKAGSATRIALHLLKEPDGPRQLLRRLSIICLEDGLLHPQVPLVVWAMMAESKGYVISGSLANALQSITYQMAAVGHRDFLPDAEDVQGPPAAIYNAPRTWQSLDAALAPTSWESLLIKCILIRSGYGGMAGDKEMLLRFAGLWLARFTGTTWGPPVLPQPAAAAAAAKVGQAADQTAEKQDIPALVQDCQQQQQQGQQQQRHESGLVDTAMREVQQQPRTDAGDAAGRYIQQQQQQLNAVADLAQLIGQQRNTLHSHQSNADPAPGQLQQQQQQMKQLPGRADPAFCPADAAAASASVSPWLQFLRAAYAVLPRPGEVQLSTHVTSLGPIDRADIPDAAVDFHVSQIVPHLLQQPTIQDALQDMVNRSAVLAARVQGQNGKDFQPLIQQTLWVFRSSYNSKMWLQQLYPEHLTVDIASGYPGMVLHMEKTALRQFLARQKDIREQLKPLWKVMATLADAYSAQEIKKRVCRCKLTV